MVRHDGPGEGLRGSEGLSRRVVGEPGAFQALPGETGEVPGELVCVFPGRLRIIARWPHLLKAVVMVTASSFLCDNMELGGCNSGRRRKRNLTVYGTSLLTRF